MNDERHSKNSKVLEQRWTEDSPRSRSLTEAERKLLAAATTGDVAFCGPSKKDDDPQNNAAHASEWKQNRHIDAKLVRWLCTNNRARGLLDPGGIHVHGARITGELDLSNTVSPSALFFWNCSFDEDINATSLEVLELDLSGSWLRSCKAGRIRVKGSVFLRGCHAQGEVELGSAEIGGSLDCDGAQFMNPQVQNVSNTGVALHGDGMSVKGGVFLRNDFQAQGEVRLLSAVIGGQIDCSSGKFINPPQENAPEAGVAVSAAAISVRGAMFMNSGFEAHGQVDLKDFRIGTTLECSGAKFINAQKVALSLDRGDITGDAFLNEGFCAEGDVALAGARIGGGLDLTAANFKAADLILYGTVVGALKDDRESWPEEGHLFLDGLIYRSIEPRKADLRLDWLDLEPKDSFVSQPYLQLAKVLGEAGDEDGRIQVLVAMKDREWGAKRRGMVGSLLKWPLKATIGYGYRPLLAFWEVAVLTALGWVAYRRSYLAGEVVPTDKGAYGEFKSTGAPPSHYTKFSPLIYSIENSLPLVKLGQAKKWQPDPSRDAPVANPAGKPRLGRPVHWPTFLLWLHKFFVYLGLQSTDSSGATPSRVSRWATSAKVLRWFLWAQILLGWLLATLFLAGISGIIKKE